MPCGFFTKEYNSKIKKNYVKCAVWYFISYIKINGYE